MDMLIGKSPYYYYRQSRPKSCHQSANPVLLYTIFDIPEGKLVYKTSNFRNHMIYIYICHRPTFPYMVDFPWYTILYGKVDVPWYTGGYIYLFWSAQHPVIIAVSRRLWRTSWRVPPVWPHLQRWMGSHGKNGGVGSKSGGVMKKWRGV